MVTLSVIIPVYKAENSIKKCVQSVLTSKSVTEVILINDGSPDNSLEVCNELRKNEPRVKVFTQENCGPAVARERGVSLAVSDYVTFVDSDDFVTEGAYDDVLEYADGVDILEFGWQKTDADGNVISKSELYHETVTGDDCILHYAKQKNTANYLCNKIFSRNIIADIKWERLFCGEDAYVLCHCFFDASNYRVIPHVLYNYVMTENSLSRGITSKAFDNIRAYHLISNLCEQRRVELVPYAQYKLCSVSANLYCASENKEQQELLKNEFEKARSRISLRFILKNGSLHRKLLVILFGVSPNLCRFLIRNRRGE
ncbi:MAG: glycosyltransferase [Clostridia bacterium]|nr:glycosyltransferase [Clostridia bacterium]